MAANNSRAPGRLISPVDPVAQSRLASYGVIDTQRDAAFDRLVFTTAQMFRVPIAIIALEDGDRLWFKARVGTDITELPRAISLCNAVTDDTVLVVEDALADERFADNPLVTGKPHIRFCACAPLLTRGGVRIGSLCVVDRTPKTLLARQIWQLAQLAASVVALLEARRPRV